MYLKIEKKTFRNERIVFVTKYIHCIILYFIKSSLLLHILSLFHTIDTGYCVFCFVFSIYKYIYICVDISIPTTYRLTKEAAYYRKEVKLNESKLSQMKTNNADPYDIKKFEEVLGESYMMIPDSDSRLKQSIHELSTFLKDHEEELNVDDSTWFPTAKTVIQQYNNNNNNNNTNNDGNDCNDVIETNVSDLKDDEEF